MNLEDSDPPEASYDCLTKAGSKWLNTLFLKQIVSI